MNMHYRHARLRTLSAMVAATLVAACGGGSDAPAPPVAGPPPPPATALIRGIAADGLLQGATACYDLNDNNACDSGEPASAAASDANGQFTIEVAVAEVGKHRLIVNVPATAIDKDTGAAVGTAFTIVAPATGTTTAHSVFVSPLTNLVQKTIDTTGQTLAQATSFVQAQLNLAVSPLTNFTAATSADNTVAANAARLVVLTQTQQAAAVAAAVGQADLSGGTVSPADVDKAVAKAVAGALPAIGASAASLVGVTGPALQTALTTAATNVVAGTGLTPAAVVVAAGIAKLPADTTVTTPEAGATLAALQYTDANNWFTRVNQATALDNTPDSNGLTSSYDVRTRMAPYAFQPTVGIADSFAQVNAKERAGDLHWNGTAWTACTLGQRNTNTLRDARGRASYNSCDSYFKGVTTRASVDIAGQSIATVVTEKILPVVGPSSYTGGGGGNGWSINVASLGAATFPAGSKLFLQTDVGTENAPAYDARAVNQVAVFSQAVAGGGDARLGTVACQNSGTALPTANLEEMVARFPGKPCQFNTQTNADGSSLTPSEPWGLTSASMGDVPNYYASLPAGTGNYYNSTGRMRVAFTGAGNATTYYQCLVRRLDGSTRNCTAIGTGTYTIATLGDARVMSFNNVPAPIQRVTFSRLFVERAGKVYFGFRNPVGVETAHVRLNLAAAQAVTFQLGLPRIQPADAPKALTGGKATTAATLKGVWGGTDATGAVIFRFGDNGEFLMAQAQPPGGSGRPGYEQGWLDYDPATGKGGVLLAIDTNGDWGTSHPRVGEGFTSITPTAINYVGGSIPRFTDDPNGIAGMWALGSATDLKVTHFVFFANGKVLSIHPAENSGACFTARQGPPGIEWSDYSFVANTGALTIFNKIYDTSGCTGVFDSTNPNAPSSFTGSLTFAADKKSFTLPGDAPGEILTFYRIAPM